MRKIGTFEIRETRICTQHPQCYVSYKVLPNLNTTTVTPCPICELEKKLKKEIEDLKEEHKLLKEDFKIMANAKYVTIGWREKFQNKKEVTASPAK